MNPYLVLGVQPDADDARIRRAYLDAIRKSTPESDPDQFKEVAAAYEKIKDVTSRCRFELFDTECPGDSPLDSVIKHACLAVRATPLPFEDMKNFLRSCAKP